MQTTMSPHVLHHAYSQYRQLVIGKIAHVQGSLVMNWNWHQSGAIPAECVHHALQKAPGWHTACVFLAAGWQIF